MNYFVMIYREGQWEQLSVALDKKNAFNCMRLAKETYQDFDLAVMEKLHE